MALIWSVALFAMFPSCIYNIDDFYVITVIMVKMINKLNRRWGEQYFLLIWALLLLSSKLSRKHRIPSELRS